MRVVILGARGQLASSLCEQMADHDVVALGREDLDISDTARVGETIERLRPEVVINTAAVRRPDDCERNPERTFAVNAIGPRNVAMACAAAGSVLVHFSTDNVFDGRKSGPYTEDDTTNPITTYGVAKLAGEQFVRHLVERHLVIRTSGLFGGAADRGTNFVLSMLQRARAGETLRVVTDQVISPTYTLDLAKKTAWLIGAGANGVYHVTNTGACSWFELARAIVERSRLDVRLVPVTTEELKLTAPRLRNAVLDNGALRRLGADDMPHWQDALGRYLQTLGIGDALAAQA
jgi:dTDP-4-dehydrorhamnose reductase